MLSSASYSKSNPHFTARKRARIWTRHNTFGHRITTIFTYIVHGEKHPVFVIDTQQTASKYILIRSYPQVKETKRSRFERHSDSFTLTNRSRSQNAFSSKANCGRTETLLTINRKCVRLKSPQNCSYFIRRYFQMKWGQWRNTRFDATVLSNGEKEKLKTGIREGLPGSKFS